MTNDNDDSNNERKPSALDAAPPEVYPPRVVGFKEPPRPAAIHARSGARLAFSPARGHGRHLVHSPTT